MDEIMSYSSINSFEELTNAICSELCKAAISFVRIGYLLKRARDEDILKDSGYLDIYEYASAKFGLDKSQVSRFIRINDRFSIGGYSEHLELKYEDFGYTKLSIMLTLPDEINEELSPEFSKSEINTIKAECEAESKISDMEVMMEDTEGVPDEFIAAVVKELNDEHPESAVYLNRIIGAAEKMGFEINEASIREAYIPEGMATYFIRIPGQGKFMISMQAAGITITNVRAPEEKSPLSWTEFKDVLVEDMKIREFKEEPEKKEPEGKKTEKREKKKPEKVKPAKIKNEEPVAPVQPEEKSEESVKIQNEKAPERLSDEDVEIVGQSTDNAAQEDEEETVQEPSIEERKFETQVIYKIEKITQHIKESGLTNWGYVKDHLQDLIRDININAGRW